MFGKKHEAEEPTPEEQQRFEEYYWLRPLSFIKVCGRFEATVADKKGIGSQQGRIYNAILELEERIAELERLITGKVN